MDKQSCYLANEEVDVVDDSLSETGDNQVNVSLSTYTTSVMAHEKAESLSKCEMAIKKGEETELGTSHNVSEPTCKKKHQFHHKRTISVYRYIGDMKNVDMSTPENARRCLGMALGCVDKLKRKIKSLHKQNHNLNKQVYALEYEIQKILSKEVINQSMGPVDVVSNTSQPLEYTQSCDLST